MPAEFENPGAAPARARGIGPRQILRWALIASAAGAILGLLRHAPMVLGVFEGAGGFAVRERYESLMALHSLSGLAMPFVVVGAGLAVAATVEARRADESAPPRVVWRLGLTWGFLAVGAAGAVIGAV